MHKKRQIQLEDGFSGEEIILAFFYNLLLRFVFFKTLFNPKIYNIFFVAKTKYVNEI